MNKNYNGSLTENAQSLRRKMTKEERCLWYDFLKNLPLTVHRQKVFGNYIVDFYIASAKLVIELDGSQHYEKEHHQSDAERDEFLKEQGLETVRYSNWEVNRQFKSVCEDIYNRLGLNDQ